MRVHDQVGHPPVLVVERHVDLRDYEAYNALLTMARRELVTNLRNPRLPRHHLNNTLLVSIRRHNNPVDLHVMITLERLLFRLEIFFLAKPGHQLMFVDVNITVSQSAANAGQAIRVEFLVLLGVLVGAVGWWGNVGYFS